MCIANNTSMLFHAHEVLLQFTMCCSISLNWTSNKHFVIEKIMGNGLGEMRLGWWGIKLVDSLTFYLQAHTHCDYKHETIKSNCSHWVHHFGFVSLFQQKLFSQQHQHHQPLHFANLLLCYHAMLFENTYAQRAIFINSVLKFNKHFASHTHTHTCTRTQTLGCIPETWLHKCISVLYRLRP